MRRLVVTIDGPAGAGKSSASRGLARRLGYRLLDTGAIYRSVALVAKRRGQSWDDGPGCAQIASALDIEFRFEGDANRVFVDGLDVTQAIRTAEMSQGASVVSALPEVRTALLDLQRRLGAQGGVVVEGRDVGTVVFPDAGAKFFLTADAEVRSRRRFAELRAAGHTVDEKTTLNELLERDRRDETRKAAPLRPAPDALVVDSSQLSLDQVIDHLEREVRAKGG